MRIILIGLISAMGTGLGAAGERALVAAEVVTSRTSAIQYDATKLTAELAFYREVAKGDFYYLRMGVRPMARGTAQLSTGQGVEWFHYECGGLDLRFADGTERYFLHPGTVGEQRAEKIREGIAERFRGVWAGDGGSVGDGAMK